MPMKSFHTVVALGIAGLLLAACSSGGPVTEPEVKTTGAAQPATPVQTPERVAHDAVAKHKLEMEGRVAESLHQRAAPAAMGGGAL